MKTALIWTLLALVPVANLQMICVDHGSATAVVKDGSPDPDCSDFCLRAEAPRVPAETTAGCVLVAGGCSMLASLVVALPERPESIAAPVTDRVAALSLPRTSYLSPALQKLTPPPKS
jgi:hypothetical protein